MERHRDEHTELPPTSTDITTSENTEHTTMESQVSTIVQMSSVVDNINAKDVVLEASVDAMNISTETTQMAVTNVNTMEMNIITEGLPSAVSIRKADCVQINLMNPDERKPRTRLTSETIESDVFDPIMDKLFVETNCYHSAKSILDKERLVIISGGIGEGKTFLANKLASEKIQKGYILKTFDSCFKVRIDEKCIFLLDNIFTKSPRYGQNSADIETLLKTIQQYSEFDQELGRDFYIIVTARQHVLNELRDNVSIPVFKKQTYRVNLTGGLTRTDKVEMFRKHESCSTKSAFLDDDLVEQICECNCPSFPVCVKLFFQQENLFEKGLRFFKNPFQVIQSDVHAFYKNDREVYTFLVMLILNDGEMDERTLESDRCVENLEPLQKLLRCEKDEINQRMNECLGRIPSTYIRNENGKIRIQHDCIYHAICISFSKILPDACLMHLPFDFITQTIRVQTESLESRDDESIRLQRKCFPSLVQRFLTEIEDGNLQLVVQHQAMSDPIFLAVFSECLQKIENTSRFLRILQSTERDKSHGCLWNGSLLYWSASLSNRNLFSKLLLKNFYQKIADVDGYFVRTQVSATLVIALWVGLLKINHIDILLNLGASVNSAIQKERRLQTYSCDFCITRDKNSATVLEAATFGNCKNKVELVTVLLEKGARLNKNTFQNTLKRIVQTCDYEMTKHLLKIHEDIIYVNQGDHSLLWYAIQGEGDDRRIVDLLAKNYTKQSHKEPLFNNVKTVDEANMLHKFGIETRSTDHLGRNSLHGVHNADLVHFLVKHGTDVNRRDEFGRTPLFYSKTSAVADALLQHGADINNVDKEGRNILHFIQDKDILKTILTSIDEHDKWGILNQRDNSGQTPIFYRSSDDELEKLKMLVKFGASVNTKSSKNDLRKSYNADIDSGKQNYEKVGEYVYSIGYSSIELTDEGKFSTFTTRQIYVNNWIAFICNIPFVPRYITGFSGEIDGPSSAIMLASDSHGKHSEKIADSETKDSQHGSEMSALPVPVKKGATVGMDLIFCGKFNDKFMDILDSLNFEWEASNDLGETVLHYLLSPEYEGITNCANIFRNIFKSANKTGFVNRQDGNKNTPLHLACLCRIKNRLGANIRADVIRILVQNGADVNIVNAWNQTPLHCLLQCRCSSFDLVLLLVSKTSSESINLPCKNEMTPLQCLLSITDSDEGFVNDAKAILEVLYEYGADVGKCLSNYRFCAESINPSLFEIFLQKYKDIISPPIVEGIIAQCAVSHEKINSWVIMAVLSEHSDTKSDDFFSRINKNSKITDISVFKLKIVKQCCQNVHRTHIVKVLKFISQSNEDIKITDKKGNNYLLKVLKYYRGDYSDLVQVLQMLMEKGANPNAWNKKGTTAIQRLILGDGPDYYIVKCLKVIAEHGATLDSGHPLIWAAKSNKLRTKVIRFLPDTISPDDEDEIGNAFHHIIKSYARGVDVDLTSINALYRKGVEINAKNTCGETPLHLAVRLNARKDIIIQLLIYYADVNRANNNGLTPLHYILLYSDVHEIFMFKEFLKYDGDLCLTDRKGRTYLHYAVIVMRPSTLKILSIILRKRVCDINAKDSNGNSVIHTACIINCRNELRHDSAITDDVDFVCDDEWCASLRLQVVRCLINNGANLNNIDANGQTVLHSLVIQYHAFKQQKQRQCLKYLHSIIDLTYLIVSRGINTSITDNHGKTASNYFTEYKLTGLEDLIERQITPEALKDKLASVYSC